MPVVRDWKSELRPYYQGLRGLWHRGRARYCPLCEKSFRKFLPKGDPARADAMCPRCLSLERHRLLWLFLVRELRFLETPLSILHFAPEAGLRTRLQSAGIRYLPVDLSPGRGKAAVDLARLGLRSGSFDLVLCCHVLEHVPDDRAALAELHRVLKPGGVAVLQVPLAGEITDEDPTVSDPRERRRRFGQEDHVRLYGRDFGARAAAAGFRVDSVDYASKLGAKEIARCRLLAAGENEDRIYLGRR